METTVGRPVERQRARRSGTLDLIRRVLHLAGGLSPRITSAIVFGLMERPRRRGRKLTLDGMFLQDIRIPYHTRSLQGYSWAGARKALLVHGWDASSSDFGGLIPRLAQTGWGGMAYDAPAHGRSDGKTTDFIDLGRAFRQVLEEYGPFDAVVSHSFGSLVALHGLADSLQPAPAGIVSGGAPATLDQAFDIFLGPLRLDPRVRSHLDRRISERLGRPLAEFSAARAVSRIDSEILILHDRRDTLVPIEAARRLTRAAQSGELVQTSGLGHRGWLTDENMLDRVVAFLEGNFAGT